jgi:membrane associated rhomboid family serine protease
MENNPYERSRRGHGGGAAADFSVQSAESYNYYGKEANDSSYLSLRPSMSHGTQSHSSYAASSTDLASPLKSHMKAYEEEYADPKGPFQSAYAPAYGQNPPDEMPMYTMGSRAEEAERFVAGSRDGMGSSRGMQTKSASLLKRFPIWCWLMSAIQLAVFIGQLGNAWKLTGSPIQIRPSFNPLIGPSVYNSINMGARYPLCMHSVQGVTGVVTAFPCPNNTASTLTTANACTLQQLCGHGAQSNTQPKQWWRFITAIFLHGGVLHIAFNLLIQLRLGPQVEREVGTPIFAFIYLVAGIGGFLFGGNFAGDGVASQGASGALFAIISLSLLDLLYRWRQINKPMQGLIMLVLDVVVSFVLGLLPGVDNFSHIGGFIFGLLMGVALMRSPDALRKTQLPDSERKRGHLFRDRKAAWWVWTILRCASLLLVIIIYILLIQVCTLLSRTLLT